MKHFRRALSLILAALMLTAAAVSVHADNPIDAVITEAGRIIAGLPGDTAADVTVKVGGQAIAGLPGDTAADVTVKVGGQAIAFPDQQPVIRDDRTLVPIRFIAENLGYKVDYNHDDHSAIIDNGRIVLYIGTDQAEINGEKVQLDTPSVLISDRTMVPLRIIAETLGCTVDWFNTNRTVLVNKRLADGSEMPVFDRFEQSGLFWAYSTQANDYLVWKANYKTLEEAADGENFDAWWIERPRDKQDLVNPFLDCTIVARTFEPETLAQIKDMFFTVYPTRYADAADLMMDSIRGELWQTFYEEDSEYYPLYSVMPPRSGTFGSYYFDNREVEMYVNETCTRLMINVNAEGYENPDIPRTLTDEEIAFYTEQAKQSYMLDLWNLD